MNFDAIVIRYTDGDFKEVPCDALMVEDGWLLLKKNEVITALLPAHSVKFAELYFDGRPVGYAKAE